MSILYRHKITTYQTGGVLTYASDPEYFDGRARYHDDPNYNDQIRKAVYSGKYGYNPGTGSLHKLDKDKQVSVDKSTQNLALTSRVDKKNYKPTVTKYDNWWEDPTHEPTHEELQAFIRDGHESANNAFVDIASNIPGIETVADAAGLVKAIANGDKASAAIYSAGLAIPFIPGRLLKKGKDILLRKKETPKSSVDWEKWVKYKEDFHNNPEVIKHLNEIEKATKTNGTWMKNPDGTPFKGTKEQFVVQQSDNFKKAFGNSKLLNDNGSPMKVYHGSAKKFDFFDESKFQLGDSGYSGKGIYTTPSKTTADSYAVSSASFHSGEITPTTYELYGKANKPIRSSELPEGYDLFDFYREKNWQGDVPIQRQLRDYDAAIANKRGMIDRVYPDKDAVEVVFPTNKQLKSAIGNILLDMSNPNIYKATIPALLGVGAATQYNKERSYRKGGILYK